MTIYPLTFRPDMFQALRAGTKVESRRMVGAGNSVVLPGMFDHCDLDSARIRTSRHGKLTEIRASCTLASGRRVVTIAPKVQPGDAFWTRPPRGRRADSRLTLLVEQVHARRIQDMTAADAAAEGIESYASPAAMGLRERFALLWDEIHGRSAWQKNDWVWVYGFKVMPANVDTLYPEATTRRPKKAIRKSRVN